ncbi:matrix-remodeling-associated protein 7 [Nilaparvata lugens]|uniref:matrix-remodeling-associated protein 7 n=2 Tax=Nilaparvata lugens TaxID=108931 RepID=UPI000B991055|nr:matrix-remodeling-associated protein 7 [Nilaparvata lugens]
MLSLENIFSKDTLWSENFSIYSENLSIYYIICISLSVLSVVFTWYFHNFYIFQGLNCADQKEDMSTDEGNSDSMKDKDSNIEVRKEIFSQLKAVRQPIVQQISSGLTEDQLKEEREAEAQQLAEIFQLLQNQEDKFNVSSMEELEDQMKLYRP